MINIALNFMHQKWILLLLSGFSLLAYAGLVSVDWRYGTLRAEFTPQTIGWYLLAFLAYLGLLFWNEKRPISGRWLWGGAVLFRVLLLFTTPTLSDDIYRYIWDGYVANEGVSPYAYAIDDPQLDYLEIPQRDLANNAWMASPYLPSAQLIFGGVTAVFPLQPIYLQIVMVIFDLSAAWIIGKLLLMALLPGHRLLIYLWNPLIIVEAAHGAHVDAWMLLLAVGAVYWGVKNGIGSGEQKTESGKQITDNRQQTTDNRQAVGVDGEQVEENSQQCRRATASRTTVNVQQSTVNGQQSTVNGRRLTENGRMSTGRWLLVTIRWTLSPLLLAMATLTKILPALLLPVMFWLWNWRQRLVYGLLVVLLLLPFGLQAGWGLTGELDGRGLFGALRIYSAQWKFNSGLFHWLEIWLGKMGTADPLAVAKLITMILLLGLLTAVWLLARTRTKPRPALRLMAVPLMGYVLLTPTLHPWYIVILLAFVPFLAPAEDESPWLWLLLAPWLYLSGALIFSYLTYLDPLNFGEREWIRQLEWLPTLLLLAASIGAYLLLRRRRVSA